MVFLLRSEALWVVWLLIGLHVTRAMFAGAVFERITALRSVNPLIPIAFCLLLAAIIYNRKQIQRLSYYLPVIILFFGLYISMLLILMSSIAILPTSTGFYIGHAIVSISWLVLAGWLMPGRRTSISMSIAAIAKLMLFDMSALTGFFRIVAFITSGLILIIIATRTAASETAPYKNQQPAPPVPEFQPQ